jgi:FAD:protein FMN transferase
LRQLLIPASLRRAPALAPPGQCLLLAGESMGTTWQVRVYAPASAATALHAAVDEELALVVRQMSHWEPASDLSRFNNAPADTLVALPDPLFELLLRAQRIAVDSAGAYDPAIGAMVRRWGFGPNRARLDAAFRIPDANEIAALRGRNGQQRLQLEPATHHVYQPGGLHLDLSAIAKGFAVDLVSQRLQREGHGCHLVEIGGELRGAGVKPDAQPWWVAIEPPVAGALPDETFIALCDHAVATSGDYRRNFSIDGRQYAHTIDPRSARPVDNDVASVTVISDECWHADAVSTALMVMGAADGLPFANRHHLAARFICRTESGFRQRCSNAWGEMLQ